VESGEGIERRHVSRLAELSRGWNPVKELKGAAAWPHLRLLSSAVESGEGIESEPSAFAGAESAAVVESGEGIESFIDSTRPLVVSSLVESGEGIERQNVQHWNNSWRNCGIR